jgi:uncharacterized protein YbbC (DUF1343 family)
LNDRKIPGVRFETQKFTPDSGPFKGEECDGVHVVLTDRNALHPMSMGTEIAAALVKLSPKKFEVSKTMFLLGNTATVTQLRERSDPAEIVAGWNSGLDSFQKLRRKYLLYP